MKKIKTIGIIAPSGDIRNIDIINQRIKVLKKNFKVKKFYNENASFGYLSDNIENKVKFFESAFQDEETDLVLALRGGFGAIQIVDKINYSKIQKTDKYFCGSSDVSILLASMYKKTSAKVFHSLMLSNGFVENLDENIKIIENNIFDINLEKISYSPCKGLLWGGNLSSIVSMFGGEEYIPNEDIILFLEDLSEPLYKIDKMIYQIFRNEKLKNKIRGIIFGDFYIEEEKILPLLKEYSKLFKVPCFKTDLITHKISNKTIPYGKFIEL